MQVDDSGFVIIKFLLTRAAGTPNMLETPIADEMLTAEGAAATAETQNNRTLGRRTSTTVRTAATEGLTAAQATTENHSNRKDVNNSGDTINGRGASNRRDH
jgi:hypothetical protein